MIRLSRPRSVTARLAASSFCYAARKGCKVRSIDYVATYLQGKFIEGEVIYCHMPPGYVELDSDGIPRVLKIVKPIYGIPQAGRRLQRQIFPWMKAQGLKPLDDSGASGESGSQLGGP